MHINTHIFLLRISLFTLRFSGDSFNFLVARKETFQLRKYYLLLAMECCTTLLTRMTLHGAGLEHNAELVRKIDLRRDIIDRLYRENCFLS